MCRWRAGGAQEDVRRCAGGVQGSAIAPSQVAFPGPLAVSNPVSPHPLELGVGENIDPSAAESSRQQ